EAFVNGIYLSVANPADDVNGRLRGEFVDEMHDQWYSFFEFNNSLLTADDLASWPHENWEDLYKSIRACNLFLKNIDNASIGGVLIDGKTLKDRMLGEVLFLRAFFYFQLTTLYGGVPLITDVYQLNDDFSIARNTYEECMDFIVDECDKAAGLLPSAHSGNNIGRATVGAALSLKSRALLYAASDLHNTTVFPAYGNQELIRYTSGDQQARWRLAKDAAKA